MTNEDYPESLKLELIHAIDEDMKKELVNLID